MSEATSTGNKYKFGKADKGARFPKGARMSREGGRVIQTFATLQDALDASRFSATESRDKWADIETGNEGGARVDPLRWYGVPGVTNAEGIRALVRDGWPDGVAQMRAALDDIGATLTPRSVRRVRRWTDQGDSVEMPRVWAGRCDVAWQRCHRESRTGPQVVTIAANITALRDVDSRALFWRGAAVLKLADLLTEAGYNVRIDAIRHTANQYTDNAGITQRVIVKEPTAPLELNSLAATVCLSGFFRSVLFQCACISGTVRKAMGQSETYRSTTGEIDGVEKCMSRDAARAWIEESIRRVEEVPLAA